MRTVTTGAGAATGARKPMGNRVARLIYSTFAQNNTFYIIDSIRMFGIGNIPFEMQRKAVETFKKDHNPQVLVSLPSISETPLYGTGQY